MNNTQIEPVTVENWRSIDYRALILSGDVEAWNKWRDIQQHPGEYNADTGELTEIGDFNFLVDLKGINLAGMALGNANLSCVDMSDANLEGANLKGANLGYADLYCANLKKANLINADLTDTTLTCAILVGVDAHGADLHGASLKGSDLTDADFTKANFEDASLDSTVKTFGLIADDATGDTEYTDENGNDFLHCPLTVSLRLG